MATTNLDGAQEFAEKGADQTRIANKRLSKKNKKLFCCVTLLLIATIVIVCLFTGVFNGSSSVKVIKPENTSTSSNSVSSTATTALEINLTKAYKVY